MESNAAVTGRPLSKNWLYNAGVPVWNGLTNEFHPQVLADLIANA